MTVYPEMNNKIVDLLRMGDTPVELYAAQRIEELELKNKELIDRVLEIIDGYKADEPSGVLTATEYNTLLARMERDVLALKGEEQ